jgi:hypothetical protein
MTGPIYFCSCQKLQSYHQFLAIAIQVIVASAFLHHFAPVLAFADEEYTPLPVHHRRCHVGMLVMRMYALYERSRRVLALYLAVCTIVVAIGLVGPICV